MGKEHFNHNKENKKFINEILSKQKTIKKIIEELEKVNQKILRMTSKKSSKLDPDLIKDFNNNLKQIKKLENKLDNLIFQIVGFENIENIENIEDIEDIFEKVLKIQEEFFYFLNEDKKRLTLLENKLRTRIIQSIYFSTFKIIVLVIILFILSGNSYIKLSEFDLDRLFKITVLIFSFIYFYTSLAVNEKIKKEKTSKFDQNFNVELNAIKRKIKYSQQEAIES